MEQLQFEQQMKKINKKNTRNKWIAVGIIFAFILVISITHIIQSSNRQTKYEINIYYENVNLFHFGYQNGFVNVDGEGYVKYLNNSEFDFVGIFPPQRRITFLTETPTESKFNTIREKIVMLLNKSEDMNVDTIERNWKYYRVWTISENQYIILAWDKFKNTLVLVSQEYY